MLNLSPNWNFPVFCMAKYFSFLFYNFYSNFYTPFINWINVFLYDQLSPKTSSTKSLLSNSLGW